MTVGNGITKSPAGFTWDMLHPQGWVPGRSQAKARPGVVSRSEGHFANAFPFVNTAT